MITCERCKGEMRVHSNAQRYCLVCARKRRTEVNTEAMRRLREKRKAQRPDRIEQKICQYFEQMGWETEEWRRA